jgi:hypoxanthine-guanine phosphoribosyltransferase
MQSSESRWISKHPKIVDKFTGKWVAILGNKGIIASGNTIKELTKELKKRSISELPLITKIPRDDEGMSIL